MKKIVRILWVFVVFLGLFGIAMFFTTIFNGVYSNALFHIDTDLASEFGDYFGGFVGTLFAAASTLLVLVTIIEQHINNKNSQIGNNFFKMIDYHTENVKQLSVSYIDKTNLEYKIEG